MIKQPTKEMGVEDMGSLEKDLDEMFGEENFGIMIKMTTMMICMGLRRCSNIGRQTRSGKITFGWMPSHSDLHLQSNQRNLSTGPL